jgi:Transposase DDE domain
LTQKCWPCSSVPRASVTCLGAGWVERTLAWIGRYQRMSKDYEYLTSSSEAMVYLTMLRLMLTRLAKQTEKQFVTYKQKQVA